MRHAELDMMLSDMKGLEPVVRVQPLGGEARTDIFYSMPRQRIRAPKIPALLQASLKSDLPRL
jgi:hypothetical protein